MQEYDVALKLLLQGQASLTMRELTGTAVAKWLNVELPRVQNRRLDLLAEAVDGGLVHVELQSGNDAGMPLRMAEYPAVRAIPAPGRTVCRRTGNLYRLPDLSVPLVRRSN
ncbi:MAG TPA: hypothetical protein VN924_17050 [Bryobacteraceae bacterium]|nr:hypothetical protein [Bryobacteraceae bacterium]